MFLRPLTRHIHKARYSTNLRDPFLGSASRAPDAAPSDTNVHVQQLPSGVRVVSVDRATPLSSVSLFLNAGSRHETFQTMGSAHFLKFFALQNNVNKSGLRFVRDLEHLGIAFETQITREHIAYHLTIPRDPESLGLKVGLESLKSALSPLLMEYEFKAVRGCVSEEVENLCPKYRLLELAHQEAFRDQGLGQPLYAPTFVHDSLDARHLHKHLQATLKPTNVTLVANGVNLSKFLEQAGDLFNDVTLHGKFPELKRLGSLPAETALPQTANWVGGEVRQLGLGDTHAVVAYPGAAFNSTDAAVLLVLQAHLENQGVNVANFGYSDAGFFGVYGSQASGNADGLVKSLNNSLNSLASLSQEAFDLAKSAAVLKEQHSSHNFRFAASNLAGFGSVSRADQLNSVTLTNAKQTASKFLKAKPVVVASGDVRGIGRL